MKIAMASDSTIALRSSSSKLLVTFLLLTFAGFASIILESRETVFWVQQPDTLIQIVSIDTDTDTDTDTASHSQTTIEAPFEALGRRVSEALGKRSFGPAFGSKLESIQTQRRRQTKKNDSPTHYRATRFELSPDRPLWSSLEDFSFRKFDLAKSRSKSNSTEVEWIDVWEAAKKSETTKAPPTTSGCVDTLVCHVDRTYSNINKWQHTMHFLFPCWSLFQRFPDAKSKIINLDANLNAKGEKSWQGWTKAVNAVMARNGITFAFSPVNATKKHSSNDNDNERCGDWMANTKLNYDGYGFQQPHGNSPYMNSYYFMTPDDIYAFQSKVLGDNFRYGPSIMVETETAFDDKRKFKVSILNREGSKTRVWEYGREASKMIQAEWDNNVDVEYIPSYSDYSLKDQAIHMHSADLIITPHGAQTTNAVFIRPCTVVLELLPYRFYHPKKLPLVMEVGGVAFYGYRHGGSPISETPGHTDTPPLKPGVGSRLTGSWNPIRTPSIVASPESITFAIPDLIEAGISCRRQWAATH
jgi:hypothetical protein